jgi:hypothetical protein
MPFLREKLQDESKYTVGQTVCHARFTLESRAIHARQLHWHYLLANACVNPGHRPPMNTSDFEYRSYLLRLWRESAQGAWRASVQSTATEQVVLFADITALLAFLLAQTDELPPDRSADQPRPAKP